MKTILLLLLAIACGGKPTQKVRFETRIAGAFAYPVYLMAKNSAGKRITKLIPAGGETSMNLTNGTWDFLLMGWASTGVRALKNVRDSTAALAGIR